MKSRPLVPVLIVVVVLVLLTGTCAGGFLAGVALAPKVNSQVDLPNIQTADTTPDASTGSGKTTEDLFVPFWEAWNIVHEQYVDQPVNDEAMMQGAIRGMMESLGDQHSSYMDPAQYSDAQAPLEGYSGIGAWVNTEGEFLTIIEPMKGSPAEAAGLKAGDEIIAIDGEDLTGIAPEVARLKVLGEAGTKVVLTVRREGVEQPFDVSVTRAEIKIPSVEHEMLENDIAYVHLLTFSDTSTEEMHQALEELMAQNPKGLIFDLRNNSGGYLVTAVDVASEFIKEGLVTYEQYGDGTRDEYNASGKGIATEVPMVVLVNEWSASASELVAGALQDYGRAQLVGVTTFGKGSVQNWIPLSNEEGAVRVTIARWYTPKGRNISEVGLVPEVVVEITDEDIQAGKDPQLEKAIELLTTP
jgi:carboxyl-terminal processing protease